MIRALANLTLLLVILPGCARAPVGSNRSDLFRAACAQAVRAALEEHGDAVEISVWIGGAEGEPWYAIHEGVPRPAASSVKTAYLVELFALHAGRLEEPLAETDAILSSPEHPAIVHFDEETQAEIRRAHRAASVRRIGQMMIRGDGVSNSVYNAAANVTTAALGGPEGITEEIRARAPDFRGVWVRRFMLADRHVTGDNEVTAEFLARVLQRIARGDIPGVDADTLAAVRDVMRVEPHPEFGEHLFKSGSLNSDPLVRIRSGCFQNSGPPVVYAVLTTQPDRAGREREEAGIRLEETTVALTERLLTLAHGFAVGQ